jgi:hypothetical protein
MEILQTSKRYAFIVNSIGKTQNIKEWMILGQGSEAKDHLATLQETPSLFFSIYKLRKRLP